MLPVANVVQVQQYPVPVSPQQLYYSQQQQGQQQQHPYYVSAPFGLLLSL
jgi:hypothetical protein